MGRPNSDDGNLFYVVKFIELPFNDVEDYVCVPHSWIVLHTTSINRAAVAYPNNEDALAIRKRVMNGEEPNEEWRFYMALIGYESETLEDAENWIQAHNKNGSSKVKSSGKNMRDSQLEPTLHRRLRSASRPFFSDAQVTKPSISKKPYKNPLPPLEKFKDMETHHRKLNEIAYPDSGGASHPGTSSEHLKESQSVTSISNQLIESTQTGIAAAVEDKTSPLCTLPDFTKGGGDKSVRFESSVDTGFDENDHEDDGDGHVESEPVMDEAQYPGKTPANSPEQVPQPEPANERSTPLVHHKQPLPEPHLQDAPARQPKEADANQRTQLYQRLATPIPVSMPSSTSNLLSQGKYPRWVTVTSTSAAHQTPQLQETNGGSSTKATLKHQRPRAQDIIKNLSSPPSCVANPVNPSAQLLYTSCRRKSPSATDNPAVKRICLQNITRSPSALQGPSGSPAHPVVKPVPLLTHRNQKEAPRQTIRANTVDLNGSQQGMTTFAAQSLSSHSLAEYSNLHYLQKQKAHLEQITRLNSQFQHHNFGQSDPNPLGQSAQFLPQHNNQYGLHTNDSFRERLRKELDRGLLGGTYTDSAAITQNMRNIPLFPTQNSLSRSPYEFVNQHQAQDLSGSSLKFNANPQITERPGVINMMRSPAQPTTPSQLHLNAQREYLHKDPRLQARLDRNPTEHQLLDPGTSGNPVDEAEPTMVDTEVQTAPLPGRLDETSSVTQPGDGVVYRNRRTKKLVVDRATEMDAAMDVDQGEDEATESDNQSAPQVADSECQVDGNRVESLEPPLQETDCEFEMSNHDVVSDYKECEDHPRVDTVSESRLTSPPKSQISQKLAQERDMTIIFGTLCSQLSTSFRHARDLYNHLRNSILKCADVYELMAEKHEKLNEVKHLSNLTSLPNDEKSKASKEKVSENKNDVSSAPQINQVQKDAWVPPPSYDPNNPKWTRKYQTKAPGLVELIPRTSVYVSKKELANCKRESKDCRTLARMLLTEVFSAEALGVCSLTGGKAKAYSFMNLEVRPGLDEYARMILLTFVEKYGAKLGWNTDDSPIISSIRTKILEMRARYNQTGRG